MRFCWEAFRSDSTDRNFLRLFGTKEMARQYGMRGEEVFCGGIKGNLDRGWGNMELCQNVLADDQYYTLKFYTGDFASVKQASKNPKGSLGWSGSFIRRGIRLILLYLYEKPLPSKAAAELAHNVEFGEGTEFCHIMDFEREIIEESRRLGVSTFWNYFQRWKTYFQMDDDEKRTYFKWAE